MKPSVRSYKRPQERRKSDPQRKEAIEKENHSPSPYTATRASSKETSLDYDFRIGIKGSRTGHHPSEDKPHDTEVKLSKLSQPHHVSDASRISTRSSAKETTQTTYGTNSKSDTAQKTGKDQTKSKSPSKGTSLRKFPAQKRRQGDIELNYDSDTNMDVDEDHHTPVSSANSSYRSSSSPSDSSTTNAHSSCVNHSVDSNENVSSSQFETSTTKSATFGLREAPVFYPTSKEFADPSTYLESIRTMVEPYGICRIVPPKEWSRDGWRQQIDPRTFTFTTKAQSVHSLQVRDGSYTQFMVRLQYYWTHVAKQELTKVPELDGLPVDLFQLHSLVAQRGGYEQVKQDNDWSALLPALHLNPYATSAAATIANIYRKTLLPFDQYVESEGLIPEYGCTSRIVPQQNHIKLPTTPIQTPKKSKRKESITEPSPGSPGSPYFTRSKKPNYMSDSDDAEEDELDYPGEMHRVPTIVSGVAQRALSALDSGRETTCFGPYGDLEDQVTEEQAGAWRKIKANSFVYEQDDAFVLCFYCQKGDKPSTLVLCDTAGCTLGAHLKCMKPPRTRIPSGRYHCPACHGEKREDNSPLATTLLSTLTYENGFAMKTADGIDLPPLDLNEKLGFGHGFGKKYNLAEYKEMAMQFATFWFQQMAKERPTSESFDQISSETSPSRSMSLDSSSEHSRATRSSSNFRNGAQISSSTLIASPEQIESEYWKLVSSGDRLVRVYYGSDVDVSSKGACSGFPLDVTGRTVGQDCPEISRWQDIPEKRLGTSTMSKSDVNFLREHGWNLNSLPYVTMLKYLGESISGVTRPMMYIGMLFSSFCWHTEDNWLYSINYIHTGAPKRWYGVASDDAPRFEKAFREALPQLFEAEPQLLHQLTTVIHPSILQKLGVQLCTTLQMEGEIVVTFPRAYHSGFNCGFNVAESVNFAIAPWLDWGLTCANDYRFARSAVFAHEKLLWRIALASPHIEDLRLLQSVHRQLSLYSRYAKAAIQRLQQKAGIDSIFQFSRSHIALIVDKDGVPIDIQEVVDQPHNISRKTHVTLMDKDGYEPDDPQCHVCGYDLFFHRVDCACKSPRIPRCLTHGNHPICNCTADQRFISFRFRNSSCKAVLKYLSRRIATLQPE
jgi:hypothetical protein